MERTTWTDERLDDFRDSVESGFAHVDRRFDQVDARFDRVESDIRDLRMTMVRGFIIATSALMTGLLGVIATLIAQG